jgi:hypothetical protein
MVDVRIVREDPRSPGRRRGAMRSILLFALALALFALAAAAF